MHCERCPFAPVPDYETGTAECYHFETHGVEWKDGEYGCTLHYKTLEKEARLYDKYIEEMADGIAKMLEEEHIIHARNCGA